MNRRWPKDGRIYHCIYCDIPVSGNDAERDHVIPRYATGTTAGDNSRSNVVVSCGDCNRRKGHWPLETAIARLVQHRLGWPKFSLAQLDWLRAAGFDMAPFDVAKAGLEYRIANREPYLEPKPVSGAAVIPLKIGGLNRV